MEEKQTILIAGATGSIGGAAALALVNGGARVVLLGRNNDKLQAYKQKIINTMSEPNAEIHKDNIETLVIDFSDMTLVKNAAAEALNRFPKIHGLILSVGSYIENGPTINKDGNEVMFAANVIGPFLFTNLLIKRMEQSNGLVLHVIALFKKNIDWNDLQNIKKHKTLDAFNRIKVLNRVFAAELARQYEGKISSLAFDPTFVIDKTDPGLKDRWPSGTTGFVWKILTILFAKHPSVAGEPIANLFLNNKNRSVLNGTLYKLYKQVKKLDTAMNDKEMGKRFWKELVKLTK